MQGSSVSAIAAPTSLSLNACQYCVSRSTSSFSIVVSATAPPFLAPARGGLTPPRARDTPDAEAPPTPRSLPGRRLAHPELADERPEDRGPLEVADSLRDERDVLRVHERNRDRALDELPLESRPLLGCRQRFACLQGHQAPRSHFESRVAEPRVAGEHALDE